MNILTENYKLYNGDCLEKFKYIEDKSIDLVLIDPPYNIGKDKWDKWKTIEEYTEFMGEVFSECQRVLKDNGSFYFFHNDFLQMVELQNYINKNTKFKFKQLLVWNKRYDGVKNKGFLDGFCEVEKLRNYQQMSEYCLFYTFQDDYIDNKLYLECVKDVQNYVKELIYKYKGNVTKANEFYCQYSGKTGNYRSLFFGKCQPVLYTEQQYKGLCEYIKQLGCNETLKTYEEILKMCDRTKYEKLRYTFNNLKEHHSVMNYEIVKKQGHITPKPVDLLEYLIKTSSNENDIILDCFMGSGSTGVACMNTNRKFIGIELDEKYFNISINRIFENYSIK